MTMFDLVRLVALTPLGSAEQVTGGAARSGERRPHSHPERAASPGDKRIAPQTPRENGH